MEPSSRASFAGRMSIRNSRGWGKQNSSTTAGRIAEFKNFARPSLNDSGGISEIVPCNVQQVLFGLLPWDVLGRLSGTQSPRKACPGRAAPVDFDSDVFTTHYLGARRSSVDHVTDFDFRSRRRTPWRITWASRQDKVISGSSIDQVFGRKDRNGVFLGFLLFSPGLSIFVAFQFLFELLELFVISFFA